MKPGPGQGYSAAMHPGKNNRIQVTPMARHAQPREVAELKGAIKANPQRYRTQPPDAALPLGNPPERMSEAAKACWFEISTYAPVGVLKGSDRLMLETLSNLVAEYLEDPKAFPIGKYTHYIGLSARFGLTTSDRQKLGVEKQDGSNPFDEF